MIGLIAVIGAIGANLAIIVGLGWRRHGSLAAWWRS